MRPEDTSPLQIPGRSRVQAPPRNHEEAHSAVANIARDQLHGIYAQQAATDDATQSPVDSMPALDPAAQPAPVVPDPTHQPHIAEAYQRTHETHHETRASDWQQYHTAWQEYYQRYYQHYYMGAVHEAHQVYASKAAELEKQQAVSEIAQDDHEITKQEAMHDLRGQLRSKVQTTTKKARSSRHFVPIAAALVVLILFSLLQFNRVIIANVKAYVTPGEIDPQNIIVDPTASTVVSKEPRLIIPKINVNVPVVYNVKTDHKSQMKAMEGGVAYFGINGANSKPGQLGNVPIAGHSSNDFIDGGNYKFVFALLERMTKGDVFYLHYGSIRYTYTVTKTQVVAPSGVKALRTGEGKAMATLITCVPLGTSKDRLLVFGEQVSPSVTDAKKAPSQSTTADSDLPGNSPTFIERIFGAN